MARHRRKASVYPIMCVNVPSSPNAFLAVEPYVAHLRPANKDNVHAPPGQGFE